MVPNFSCERFTLLSVLEEQPYQTPAPAIIPLWIEYVKGTTLVGTVASCQLLVGGWIYWKCFRRSTVYTSTTKGYGKWGKCTKQAIEIPVDSHWFFNIPGSRANPKNCFFIHVCTYIHTHNVSSNDAESTGESHSVFCCAHKVIVGIGMGKWMMIPSSS